MVDEFAKYNRDDLKTDSPQQCHLLMAHVKNKSVANHKDGDDCGLAVSTTFGNFAGGEFCLPELNERLEFRNEDFLLMNAKVLAHCVGHFDGERTSLVFTSKSDAEYIVPHVDYMDAGEEQDKIKWRWPVIKADHVPNWS
jgi:hypothetical protein